MELLCEAAQHRSNTDIFSAAGTPAGSITYFRQQSFKINILQQGHGRVCLILNLKPALNYNNDLKARKIPGLEADRQF